MVSFTHFRISNEDYAPIFSVVEVALSGINPFARYCTLSFSERNVLFPGAQSCFTCTCKAAWDAHVVLSHMHMSYCFTCTSKTRLLTGERDVPSWERQSTIPNKGIDIVYGYFRYRKDIPIIFVTIQIWIYLRLDDLRCTIEVTLLKACFSADRDRVIPIVHRKSSNRK